MSAFVPEGVPLKEGKKEPRRMRRSPWNSWIEGVPLAELLPAAAGDHAKETAEAEQRCAGGLGDSIQNDRVDPNVVDGIGITGDCVVETQTSDRARERARERAYGQRASWIEIESNPCSGGDVEGQASGPGGSVRVVKQLGSHIPDTAYLCRDLDVRGSLMVTEIKTKRGLR
jgi:hypothetical protein